MTEEATHVGEVNLGNLTQEQAAAIFDAAEDEDIDILEVAAALDALKSD